MVLEKCYSGIVSGISETIPEHEYDFSTPSISTSTSTFTTTTNSATFIPSFQQSTLTETQMSLSPSLSILHSISLQELKFLSLVGFGEQGTVVLAKWKDSNVLAKLFCYKITLTKTERSIFASELTSWMYDLVSINSH